MEFFLALVIGLIGGIIGAILYVTIWPAKPNIDETQVLRRLTEAHRRGRLPNAYER